VAACYPDLIGVCVVYCAEQDCVEQDSVEQDRFLFLPVLADISHFAESQTNAVQRTDFAYSTRIYFEKGKAIPL
jgi:hypothetical protein